MSIVLGYTKASDDADVVIGNYDSPALAEDAIASQSLEDVATYWLASFIHPETNEPNIFAYIDV
jgi:hypothetical protein